MYTGMKCVFMNYKSYLCLHTDFIFFGHTPSTINMEELVIQEDTQTEYYSPYRYNRKHQPRGSCPSHQEKTMLA